MASDWRPGQGDREGGTGKRLGGGESTPPASVGARPAARRSSRRNHGGAGRDRLALLPRLASVFRARLSSCSAENGPSCGCEATSSSA